MQRTGWWLIKLTALKKRLNNRRRLKQLMGFFILRKNPD